MDMVGLKGEKAESKNAVEVLGIEFEVPPPIFSVSFLQEIRNNKVLIKKREV